MSAPLDIQGVKFAVGQKVARAMSWGSTAHLAIQEVTRIENGKVYLDNSPQALKKLSNVMVLK